MGWNQQAVRCFAVGWGEDETLKLLCLGEIAETVCARRLLTSCDWSDLRTGWRENRPETVDVRVETWKKEVFRWNLPKTNPLIWGFDEMELLFELMDVDGTHGCTTLQPFALGFSFQLLSCAQLSLRSGSVSPKKFVAGLKKMKGLAPTDALCKHPFTHSWAWQLLKLLRWLDLL